MEGVFYLEKSFLTKFVVILSQTAKMVGGIAKQNMTKDNKDELQKAYSGLGRSDVKFGNDG